MNLFRTGDFTLASGLRSDFKIDCDALTAEDWRSLASVAVTLLPSFGTVEGVPTGGTPFADALRMYATGKLEDGLLVADDVLTTGRSMSRYLESRPYDGWMRNGYTGVCVFSRGDCPAWVTPIFLMSKPLLALRWNR